MQKVLFTVVITLMSLLPFTQKERDYITMKSNGKVYWICGGQTIQMAIDVAPTNGSAVNYKRQRREHNAVTE